MRPISLILAVCVTGCVSQPQMQALPNHVLCAAERYSHGNEQMAAGAELRRRSFVCTPQDVDAGHQAVMASKARRAAESDAMTNAGIYLLTQPTVAPAPLAAPLQCRSVTVGNVTRTECQ